MKTFVLYAVAVAVLVAAGVAYSAVSPGAKLQKQDRVYGGGRFGPGCFTTALCFANPRNFAVDAHAQGDGSDAVGNTTYGVPGAAFQQDRSVTCVRVDGSRAAIGGIVESGSDAGAWYVQYFVDRGGPSAAPGSRDLASPSFQDAAGASSWAAGFPYACPPPTTGFPGAEPVYLGIDEGDVVVQDAASD